VQYRRVLTIYYYHEGGEVSFKYRVRTYIQIAVWLVESGDALWRLFVLKQGSALPLTRVTTYKADVLYAIKLLRFSTDFA
jgi:hypothetical protein